MSVLRLPGLQETQTEKGGSQKPLEHQRSSEPGVCLAGSDLGRKTGLAV